MVQSLSWVAGRKVDYRKWQESSFRDPGDGQRLPTSPPPPPALSLSCSLLSPSSSSSSAGRQVVSPFSSSPVPIINVPS
ncbi:hypothetical protein PYCCODRAFT_1174069 [Trametes coccinea BRFM310]|uniref:Uncharacterized protein n=1 Tax=Trametes coccinea (strain BRFM310) TaxID=1353009 RepID=A0A1Y2J0L5_TRAC3|nr:hypothetical protein PYCCODRAFT_1174069 [Trametes coccinea BRFM310]